MKYTVEFLENKKILVGGVEKEIKEGSFIDESGTQVNATIWRFDKDNKEFPNFAEIAPGSTFEANPWSKPGSDKITLYAPKISATGGVRGAGMMAMKEKSIAGFQAKKEASIAQAQDRSAWMWSKTNAATLLAAKEGHLIGKTLQNIADDVTLLATKIYNSEPIEPF